MEGDDINLDKVKYTLIWKVRTENLISFYLSSILFQKLTHINRTRKGGTQATVIEERIHCSKKGLPPNIH